MLPAKNPIISNADNAIDRFIFCLPWPTQSRSQSTNSMIAREVWRYAKRARFWATYFRFGHYRKSHSAVPLSVPQQRTFAKAAITSAKCQHEMTFAAAVRSDVLSSGADDFRYLARASRIGRGHIVGREKGAQLEAI